MKILRNTVITLFFLSSLSAFAQKNAIDTGKLDFVKKQYTLINHSLLSFKKIIKEDTEESTEGNEITLFFKGDTIEKISAVYYGETGKSSQEYYFFNKKMIFYYFEEDRYDMPIYVNNGAVKIKSKKEKRYYLNDGKIFSAILYPKRPVSPSELRKFSVETEKEAKRLLHLK